jgi:hypothetical protein
LLLLPVNAGSDLVGLMLSPLPVDDELGAKGENVDGPFMLAEGRGCRSTKEKEGKGGLLKSLELSAAAYVVGGVRIALECMT